MPNPGEAYKGTECDYCGEEIEEGENVFFEDGEKFCEYCAESNDNICDCGQFKKSEYKTCFDCKNL